MKVPIKKQFYYLCLSFLTFFMTCGIVACGNDDKPFVSYDSAVKEGGSDLVKGINVALTDFEFVDAETRTTYAPTDGGMKVTWTAGDTLGVFPNVGGQVEFPISEGTESNQAKFDGGGWALRASNTYAAYYPYSKWNIFRDNKTILLDYTGQHQTANGSTAHLGKYDYQATGGVQTNGSGYLNFQFKHLGALMQFQLTVPKAGVYTSLTLMSSENIFVTKAELDISGEAPVVNPTQTSNTITLNLNNIELTSDNAVLSAYLMVSPVDLSQGSLELTIDGDRLFSTALTGNSLEAGKQYVIEKSFEDNTTISFADEGVKTICIENWDTNGDGELSYEEAAAVTDIGDKFHNIYILKESIKSFDEFQYFTGVTSIGEKAFYACNSLTSIVIPKGVTSIESGAFTGCSSLMSIVIPKGVTSISDAAFSSCVNLTKIFVDKNNVYYDSRDDCNAIIETNSNTLLLGCASTVIPNSVTSIGNYAFLGCSNLTSIVIPEGVTSIGEKAFTNCSSLTSIEIPVGVTSIESDAISGCSSLTSLKVNEKNVYFDSRNDCNAIIETKSNTLVVGCASTIIPSSVTSIGQRAFFGCINLTSIVIPEGVTSIGSEAFNNCSSLTSIEIPESVSSIGQRAFYRCKGLISIEIPKGVTSISNGVFWGCWSLTSIEIPDSVTSIGEAAFGSCSSLTSIVIPESVTSIGSSTFSGCASLTSIVIPEGVTSIGDLAFSSCGLLTSITCLATNPPTLGVHAFDRVNASVYVPAASVEAYKAADGWKDYADRIQAIPE